jgi:hypothetical protein
MKRIEWRRSAVGLLALAATACGAGGDFPDRRDPFPASLPTTVRIIVQNRNFQDARLYTYRRGTRSLLGTVPGKADREFVINWDFPDPMSVEIDMLAGPRCITEELMVDPGDILELQIAPRFSDTAGCRRR